MKKRSQKDRILSMLMRKRGATVHEMFVHSNSPSCRITELKREGWRIEAKKVKVNYSDKLVNRYRVVGKITKEEVRTLYTNKHYFDDAINNAKRVRSM